MFNLAFYLGLQLTIRGLALGRESPQELSRLNVSPPDAKLAVEQKLR